MRANRHQVGEIKEVASEKDQERSTVLKLDLERALENLPLELKHVFVLAGIYQWPIRDVASFLRIPPGTVK
ncbi:sigma factor-like helix-turn-helix DNA-binding protein [Alicyclobacillus fructus]|uniref:sigma factor-like helix-turn-helix DNA-binding protein n=1 Tax=Alicyclobacillus fructus TaxID=2816082 RepID=UPI001A8D874C|nr:sigma factor-like helix-turn-helix DNA-binding protein [Alicyclobacillus fructus]